MNDAHRCGCGVCTPYEEAANGNTHPCDHCGDTITDEDGFHIFSGLWIVHSWCRDAWVAADMEADRC